MQNKYRQPKKKIPEIQWVQNFVGTTVSYLHRLHNSTQLIEVK